MMDSPRSNKASAFSRRIEKQEILEIKFKTDAKLKN